MIKVKCPVCGTPLKDGTCGYCGYEDRPEQTAPSTAHDSYQKDSVQTEVQPITINNLVFDNTGTIPGTSRKNKTTALVLCIFLGGLGAHRFYVGKVGTGILYLLTAGLCGLGWIADIILIAIGSFKDEFDLPLQ